MKFFSGVIGRIQRSIFSLSGYFFFLRLVDSTGYFKNSELRAFLDHAPSVWKISSFLEIGTFEGACSLYLSRFPNVTCIDTVDPFPGVDPASNGVSWKTKSIFQSNQSLFKNSKKINQFEMTSDAFFENNTRIYDFIYVDGSHSPEQAIRDLNNSSVALNRGGILWIDDYGSDYILEGRSLRDVILSWVRQNSSHFTVIHEGYQLGMMKTSDPEVRLPH
jgi:hypothetical protein